MTLTRKSPRWFPLISRLGAVVWVIDPDLRTITVYSPTGDVETLSVRRELSADDYLPGFRVSVARLFE